MSRLSLKEIPDPEDCPLTCLLLQWEKFLDRASPWRVLRAGMRLPDSKVIVYCALLLWFVCGPFEVAATFATGGNLTEAMVGVQWMTGGGSGLTAVYLLRRRRHEFTKALNDLAKCTYDLEKDAESTIKDITIGAARRKRNVSRFYFFYCLTTIFGIPSTFVTMRPHWAEAILQLWKQVSGEEPTPSRTLALQIALGPVTAAGILGVVISFYSVIPLLFVLYGSAGDLHRAIATGIKAGPCTAAWAAAQSRLIRVSAATRVAAADLVPFIIAAGFVLPLFCTVDVILNGGEAGGIAINSTPLVLIVLVASCEVGETMSSSLKSFSDDAYSGPWLEEAVAARRLRLHLMQASTVPSIQFHGRGIGALNRRACNNALRIWFRFLQAVLNFG